MEDDDETETYRLVTSVRGSSLNGLISIDSPLGKAVLGRKLNDRVYIKVNDSYGYYAIIKKIIKTNDEKEDQESTENNQNINKIRFGGFDDAG